MLNTQYSFRVLLYLAIIMSSIVTAVFKATIGLLVNKGRNKAAEKLKDGDVTDQKIRDMIVREIDDIKSKLDGLARKDLLTSISYFRRGVVHLFELLDKAKSEEDGSVTAGTVMGTDERSLEVGLRSPSTSAAAVKTVSIAEGLKNLKLTHLDDADKRALSNAKEGFKVACLKATEAFNNEALSTSDRIQAMVIRVAATILENVDYPEDAIAACILCLEDLHSMPAVQNSFAVEFKKGFWALFSQAERSEIICTVYRLNRVIYDVTLMVCFGNKGLSNWPCVDYREGKVDPLRDPRVAETLRKLGMEHLWLPWSFGQEGDNRLKYPLRIAINSQGQFLVADCDRIIKVFDSSGKFLHSFRPQLQTDDNVSTRKTLYISDIATDHNDNIYIAALNSDSNHVYVYEKTAGLLDTFHLREGLRYSPGSLKLTISENNKVLILGIPPLKEESIVDVYETDGQFVRSFGEGILKDPSDITAADGSVMVADCSDTGCVHIFSEEGDHLKKFKLEQGSCKNLKIAFHQASGHVLVASERKVLIYTKDGQFVRSVEHHAGYIRGITVSEAGRIAVVSYSKNKVVFLQ